MFGGDEEGEEEEEEKEVKTLDWEVRASSIGRSERIWSILEDVRIVRVLFVEGVG
jgi:hypothetical protein